MSTRHEYLSGTLISDPFGSISPKGTPGVKFTLRNETGDEAAAVNFWCFVADLWPTILGCRKGDALSLVGHLRKESGISQNDANEHSAEFVVRRLLSVRKLAILASHEPDLSEAA